MPEGKEEPKEEPTDPVEEAVEEDVEQEDPQEEPTDDGLDLERAKAKIAKANDEAKNLRTRLRETEEELKGLKSAEEVDEIVQRLTAERESAERELLVENVALKFGLPEKLHKRITGSTREEMEADAKELAALFGTSEEDDGGLEGGLTPRGGQDADSDDPRVLAQMYGRRGRRR